jgi:hypothetical protein
LIDKLGELDGFMYCFQFSLTPYGKDIETNLPSKADVLLPTFRELSDKIGADRVIWRYDPILVNEKYTTDFHIRAFGKIAGKLGGYTRKVTISSPDYNPIEFLLSYVKGGSSILTLHLKCNTM